MRVIVGNTAVMAAITDLDHLLSSLRPEVRGGEFVFCSVPALAVATFDAEATVVETEGVSVVLRREAADDAGLAYDFVASWITLTVNSSLEAVGLTATVAARLAAEGISCNVIAGFYHDHLLVPADRCAEALGALQDLGGPLSQG